MNLATLANLKPTLIQLLNANRGAYAATVGTNSATKNSAYPYDQEITDALLRADGHIITEGYFKSLSSLRNRFFITTATLNNGSFTPEFVGLIGKVEYSTDGINWDPSDHSDDRAGIIDAAKVGSYVGVNSFAHLHHLDQEEGVIYHAAPYLRITHPSYIRTTALQALEAHDAAILCFALKFLYKNKSQAAFEWYGPQADELLERIRGGVMDMDDGLPRAMSGGAGQ